MLSGASGRRKLSSNMEMIAMLESFKIAFFYSIGPEYKGGGAALLVKALDCVFSIHDVAEDDGDDCQIVRQLVFCHKPASEDATVFTYRMPGNDLDFRRHSVNVSFEEHLLRLWLDGEELSFDRHITADDQVEMYSNPEEMEGVEVDRLRRPPVVEKRLRKLERLSRNLDGMASTGVDAEPGQVLYTDGKGDTKWIDPCEWSRKERNKAVNDKHAEVIAEMLSTPEGRAALAESAPAPRVKLDVEPLPEGAYGIYECDFKLLDVSLIRDPEPACRIRLDDETVSDLMMRDF